MQNVKRGRLCKFESGLRFALIFAINVKKKKEERKAQICLCIILGITNQGDTPWWMKTNTEKFTVKGV